MPESKANNGSESKNFCVEVSNLGVKFGEFWAVRNVSFSVEQGEIFGFLGANGAGKTTTIRVLCGLLLPSTGQAFVGGKDVFKDPIEVKKSIGYMSQRFTLYNDLTVKENLDFAAAIRKLSAGEFNKQMEWIQSFVDLKSNFKRMVQDLSGGLEQQVSLAASLLHNPSIIFLDEPTAGVTPLARAHFWDLIRSLAKAGKTVFVTTHYMDEAEYCDRIALMRDGELIAMDSPKNLKKTSFKFPVYEIECRHKDCGESLSLLKNHPDVLRLDPFGLRYHLFLKSMNAWPNAQLQEHFAIKEISPTLEDVFIHLVEAK